MSSLHLQRGFTSLFLDHVEKDPERVYFSFEGVPYSFRQTDRIVGDARAWLAGLGARPGDRIALMMDSCPVKIAIILALATSGLTWIPINTRQKKDGLRYILEQSEPRFIVANPSYLEVLAHAGVDQSDDRLLIVGDSGIPTLPGAPADALEATPDQLFAIMYTSGTTGPPKGVMITHRMMAYAAEAVALVTDARDDDVMFMWEPLFHIGGAQMLVLPLIRRVSLAVVRRFSVSKFWQQVIEAGATHIHYLGGILDMLLKSPQGNLDRGHRVRIAWGAGCSAATWRTFEDRFGVRIRECYGMSEASSITTANIAHVVGSVGAALPWFDVQIWSREDKPLPAGECGEIVVTPLVTGPVFAGYYRNKSASARALREGRLHTGDLGYLDEQGNLYFLGRNGDSVRHKGENVSAWEVESVVNKHSLVASSAMIGVPGALGEQDIMLFVEPLEGATLDIPTFARWLADELASYQMPRYIQLVHTFERTPSERIMKHMLKPDPSRYWDRLSQQLAAVQG